MLVWGLNTYTSEADNKDTRKTYFMLFLYFYCWRWTNFVHWFSCIFDIFHKLMFPLFWTSKRNLGMVLRIEKNRRHYSNAWVRKVLVEKMFCKYSRINKILYSVKLETQELLMTKKSLRFYIFYCLKPCEKFEMEACLLMGRRGEWRGEY